MYASWLSVSVSGRGERMTRKEVYNRIDAIIAKHEIDDDYVTITSVLDYDALRIARKTLEQEDILNKIRADIE